MRLCDFQTRSLVVSLGVVILRILVIVAIVSRVVTVVSGVSNLDGVREVVRECLLVKTWNRSLSLSLVGHLLPVVCFC